MTTIWTNNIINFLLFTIILTLVIPEHAKAEWHSGGSNIWDNSGITKFKFDSGYFIKNDGRRSPVLRVPIKMAIRCGDGEVIKAAAHVIGGHSVLSIQPWGDGSALFQDANFELYTGAQFSTEFNVKKAGSYQKYITIYVEKDCQFPDLTTRYFQDKVMLPISYRVMPFIVDKHGIVNSKRKDVGFRHTCSRGWVISGTAIDGKPGKRTVERPSGHRNPARCVKQ